MVGSGLEKLTTGRYGVAVLPLLTGKEEFLGNEITKYTRKSRTRADVHASLLTSVGSWIRILRGHRLLSAFSPIGGVRFDGL
jgi:hypothetical protein